MLEKLVQWITTGWILMRVIYVAMGVFLIGSSYEIQQWFGVTFGLYFASIGVFGFGCASGARYPNSTQHSSNLKEDVQLENVEFEKLKMK
jgi:hypothetical protein